MVNNTVHLLPDHWKADARKVADAIALASANASYSAENSERAICELIDRCVKEAVLLNTAEVLEMAERP